MRSSRRIIIATILCIIFVLVFTTSSFVAGAEPADVYYKVQPGDFLWLIGWKFESPVEAIMSANKLTSTQIVPGQVLKIPKSTGYVREAPKSAAYTVGSGDSLYLISRRFGIGISEIMAANGLKSSTIYVGQSLKLPVPAQARYTVQNGDTLYLIAKEFNANIEMLKLVNKMKSDLLWVGQVLFVPEKAQVPVSPQDIEIPNETKEPQVPAPAEPPKPPIPYGGQWGIIPEGVVLYHTKAGDNLWLLAQRFGTTEAAITATNHLHTDLLMVNQPLFIPQNSDQPVTIPYPEANRKEGYGELMDWEYVSWVFDTHNVATLKDLDTGKSFRVRRLGGSNHADVEPLTAADTEIMKEIYGGQWSWNRRAVLVYVDDKVIAGSMAGMPHSIQTIADNDFPGHFDLHFLNSRTHNSNTIDTKHQEMVQKAAGN
ncbi:peptidoglycan-binding lysin domain-containing protein [Thermincola ferriacetica]|uniref:Peptidoglycan-binding lysin domain-containing protein n=1 Tax=Thermincola ferriacetica TaxID=281456 RepID=A0A0L6VZH6_9FIRM|nr:LysM peptidoglycan-binding domain-containing protein [Thermincola ferriacetica]KNZ68249.1 peptidoglycan-binding lysin domain-containing protein [Thermincola ferriacetica]